MECSYRPNRVGEVIAFNSFLDLIAIKHKQRNLQLYLRELKVIWGTKKATSDGLMFSFAQNPRKGMF